MKMAIKVFEQSFEDYITGASNRLAYAAAKAGLEGLTRAIAMETAKNNITVNALALGFFDKGMIGIIVILEGIRVSPEPVETNIREIVGRFRLIGK